MNEYSNDAVALPLYIDFGDGRLHEFPVLTFRVVGGEAFGVQGFAPSIVGVGETAVVSVRTEDVLYNRATGAIPAYEVTLNGEPHTTIEATQSELGTFYSGAVHLLELRLDEPGVYRLAFQSPDGKVRGQANPILVTQDPDLRLYWGETHGHCGFAEGMGTADGYFRFARDDAYLDFVTLSEHDIWLDDGEWQFLNQAAERFTREGDFLVYPGYEWTSTRTRGGHHNVFFRRPGHARVNVQRAPVLSELYLILENENEPKDALVIPHAHQAGDWRLSNYKFERLIEIMSQHGTFEWFGQKYLENGYQVGFIAASDDHKGHPGYAPGNRLGLTSERSNLHEFGGLAAVLAPEKTIDAVFDGLRDRQAYATNGANRIILLAELNGKRMGTNQRQVNQRVLEGRAIGTAPIDRIDIVKNGEVVHSDRHADGERGSFVFQVHFESDSVPLFRDNPRGQHTWKGRLRVEGAKLKRASLPGKVNRSFDRADLMADGTVAFSVATRGLRRSFELEFEKGSVTDAARIEIELEPEVERGTAPPRRRRYAQIPEAAFAFPIGRLEAESEAEEMLIEGYHDRIWVQRLGAALTDDVTFRYEDQDETPDDWYYVRVQQVDGGIAWSSPFWVGAEPPQ